MFLTLENQGLIGTLEHHQDSRSYIVRVYMASDYFKTPETQPTRVRINDYLECWDWTITWAQPLHTACFGNGVTAEDKLLELMEHPAWTCLKFG